MNTNRRFNRIRKVMARGQRNEAALTRKENENSPMVIFFRRRVARDTKMLERLLNEE